MAGPEVTVDKDYLDVIQKKVEDLKVLIEVSAIISSTLDFNALMSLVMKKAKAVMDAEACSILLYNRDTNRLEFDLALCGEEAVSDILKRKVTLEMGQGIAGWVAENKTPLLIKDAKTDSRFYPEADRLTGFTTKSLIAVPLSGRRGLIGVAEIINPRNKDSFSDYDVEIFQTLCRQVAIAIENARFHKESVERERLRQEIEIAATLQRSFLPESPVFKKGNLTVSAVNITATKVGGDIYDFIEPVENRVGIFVGDVCGKGISAALYMAKIISDFRYIAHMKGSPEEVMGRLNSILSSSPRGMFLTAVYIISDANTGEIEISAAGHPPPLYLTKGEVRVMDVPSGPPLGVMSYKYPASAITLQGGDRLILLTDGVFEARNTEGQRIGFDRIVEFIKKNRGEAQLVKMVIDYVDDFSRGTERADDLTMVEMRWGSESG